MVQRKNRKKVCLHIQRHSLLKIQAFWENIQIWKIARKELNTICYSFENYSLKFSWEIWISRRNSRFNLKDASAVGLPLLLSCKESTCNAGDLGATSGLGISPGEGKGYPLQYSGLENSVDCLVHELAKSQTRLSIFHFLHFSAVSRETHTHRKRPFKTEARLGYITFSKWCWRLHSTLACAVSFPNGPSPVNFRGVPISSSASAPKKILSSKSPTVKTYSSYSLFTALLKREFF